MLALVVSVSAPFSNEQGGSREALPTWPDVRKGSTTIHHVVGPIDRGGDLHHRSVDSCAVAIWQIPREWCLIRSPRDLGLDFMR